MKPFVDLTGKTFGLLSVVEYAFNYRPGQRWWLVLCQCDRALYATYSGLKSGHVTKCRSCATHLANPALKHGEARRGQVSPEHRAWTEMLGRCLNRSNPAFPSYGGRGITVHPPWQVRSAGFAAFLAHVGRRPSPQHSLDRKDNHGSYVPGNVRWATRGEQNRNKRSNIRVTIRGETLTVAEWSRRQGLPGYLIYRRLKDGWDPQRAVLAPLNR